LEKPQESQAEAGGSIQIAVSSSARNEVVGIGGVIQKQPPKYRKPRLKAFSITLGVRSEQNPDSGELAAIAHALKTLPVLKLYRITLLTSSKVAALTLGNPRQQSGQEHVCLIYKLIRRLRKNGNRITIRWVSTSEDNQLLGLAKVQARAATQEDPMLYTQLPRIKSTTLDIARSQQGTSKRLPKKVGKHVKRVDAALPGKHTRQLYDRLPWKEASVMAQLRTGTARLNGYLYRINVAPTDQCACGQARETVEHFLFRCRRWTAHRIELLQCTNTHRGNISFFLGGKSPLDIRTGLQTWKGYGRQYGSQSPPADSTPFNQTDEHKSPTLPELTHTNHLVPDRVDALQLEKRLQASLLTKSLPHENPL
jgi:ribonuclease HI